MAGDSRSGFGVTSSGGYTPPQVDRIRGLLLGLYRDNGKENGNYYNGLYWDI